MGEHAGVELETVQRRLLVAISNLMVDDWRLLAMDTTRTRGRPVNEVAVAVALAWHVKAVMERSWDVDCEYSRASDEDGGTDVKRVVRDRAATEVAIRPDLVIHRRGCKGRNNNLLVLELKTNNARQAHVGGSFESVLAVQERYEYHHGVLLDLGLDDGSLKPQWRWTGEKGSRDLVDVYSPTSVTALQMRGRQEEERRYGLADKH